MALLAFLLVFTSVPAKAAERVWDGGATVSIGWTDAANWVSRGLPAAPAAGDDLRFPAGALKLSNNNNFPAGTVFNLLTYASAGYTASGNEIGLTGGIVVSHGAGNTVLNLPISVEANQTFAVSLAGANLFLNRSVDLGRSRSALTFDGAGQTIVSGNISGSGFIIGGGAIRKNGSGTLWILQDLTLSGSTTVNGGTLRVDGSLSNSAVTVNASATLRGTGKVGGLTVNSGGTVGPGLNLPAILDSGSDVALNAGSILNIRLNGTTAGINYDQLRVQGAVSLGGTLNVTASFVPAVGDVFTIIENDGTDSTVGTFAGLPERAILMVNGRPFQISYGNRGGIGGPFGRDVNDVTLEAVPALAAWDAGGVLNKFWLQPLNWVGDVVPMPGDDIQFSSAGSGTLITSNDFPAGRVVGEMVFIGGIHLVGGNLAQINGGIQVNTGSDLNEPFRHVNVAMPLVLGASQTFEVNNPKAVLFTDAPIDLGNHNLTVESYITGSYVSSENSQITIRGGIGGQGTLIKNGPGNISLLSPSTCAHTIVNGGTFRLSAFSPSFMTGSVTVNGGATLEVEDDIGGDVVVNSGGTLRGIFASMGGNVDVDGGVFQSWQYAGIAGNLRMVNGASYGVAVRRAGTMDYANPNGAEVGGTVELDGCVLSLYVDPVEPFPPGSLVSVLSHANNGRTGTFAGLPEGIHILAGGRFFGVHYRSSDVALMTDEPFTWDGGGSGNLLSTASNWVADFAPIPGCALRFPQGVSKLVVLTDFPAGTVFDSLTFQAPSYILAGNSFQLTGGIYSEAASGDILINADFVASGSPFECGVSNASRLRLEGGVTGNAVWKKTGAGTLRFGGTAPNSQSKVEVWGGELELDKPSGVDAISALLEIGDGTNDVRVTLLGDHQIADTAQVTIRNRARLDLNGQDEAIDRLQGDGTVSLTGRFIPGRSARLTVSSGNFSGIIVGDGGLTKVGSSSLFLSGDSTFTGLTFLNGGTLSVEGMQTNSPIRLNGGLLVGRGYVGTLTANLGGVVQPGANVAAFQNRLRSLDVAFNAATTFRPLLTSASPDFENSQLQVSGAVNLGGSALDIELLFVPSPGSSFVIIDNDGTDAVVGTFAGLPNGAQFTRSHLTWRITYAGGDGNDVVLTLLSIDFQATIVAFSTELFLQPEPGRESTHLVATGVPRAAYELQRSSNLLDWTLVFNTAANADGILDLRFSSFTSGPQRFYRLKLH